MGLPDYEQVLDSSRDQIPKATAYNIYTALLFNSYICQPFLHDDRNC